MSRACEKIILCRFLLRPLTQISSLQAHVSNAVELPDDNDNKNGVLFVRYDTLHKTINQTINGSRTKSFKVVCFS